MLDKSKDKIGSMFDEIAPTYDLLNHMFTANMDRSWRKKIISYVLTKKRNKDFILDLASGTGDLTKELISLMPKQIIAADISEKMLEIQKSKVTYPGLMLAVADAERLPYEDNYFDLITIGFGARNFENLRLSLKEIGRVLKTDGMLVVLEIFRTSGMAKGIFNFYFGKVIPFLGDKISKSTAYTYLFNSVDSFYTVEEFSVLCKDSGLSVEHRENNFFGIVNTFFLRKE